MKTLPQLIADKIISLETIEALRLAGWYLRPLAEQEHEHAAQIAAVKEQEDRWAEKFVGSAPVGASSVGAIRVGGKTREIGGVRALETLVPISQDMVPHLSEVFAERDLLIIADPTLAPDAAMRLALKTVTQRKEEANGA